MFFHHGAFGRPAPEPLSATSSPPVAPVGLVRLVPLGTDSFTVRGWEVMLEKRAP